MDHEWQHFLSLLCVMGIDGNYYHLIPILIYGWVLLPVKLHLCTHSSLLGATALPESNGYNDEFSREGFKD